MQVPIKTLQLFVHTLFHSVQPVGQWSTGPQQGSSVHQTLALDDWYCEYLHHTMENAMEMTNRITTYPYPCM